MLAKSLETSKISKTDNVGVYSRTGKFIKMLKIYLAKTFAPSLKKSSAEARPIPWPAAVTIQIFPFKLIALKICSKNDQVRRDFTASYEKQIVLQIFILSGYATNKKI